MSESEGVDVIARSKRMIREQQRQYEADKAAEDAKWRRCNTPQPIQRENAGPSVRFVQLGRRR